MRYAAEGVFRFRDHSLPSAIGVGGIHVDRYEPPERRLVGCLEQKHSTSIPDVGPLIFKVVDERLQRTSGPREILHHHLVLVSASPDMDNQPPPVVADAGRPPPVWLRGIPMDQYILGLRRIGAMEPQRLVLVGGLHRFTLCGLFVPGVVEAASVGHPSGTGEFAPLD